MVGQPIKKQRTDNRPAPQSLGKVGQLDLWGMIDEVEEKYADLIDELEGETPHKDAHSKMKVTGASTREIPRLQEARGTSQQKRRGKK